MRKKLFGLTVAFGAGFLLARAFGKIRCEILVQPQEECPDEEPDIPPESRVNKENLERFIEECRRRRLAQQREESEATL